jgi:adenylate kinase
MIYRIAILGPQGAGKGTQAELIAQHFHLPVISTGEIFRQEIKAGTELGRLTSFYIKEGKLVPDEITNELVKLRLFQDDCQNGFVLDGYPRNVFQLGAIERITDLTHVIQLDISDTEAFRRLMGRRFCPQCGRNYHLEFKPPKKNGLCDFCGIPLQTREDDKPEAIQERLRIYHRETEPVLGFYQGKGILYKINGEQPIEKVFAEILKIFE